MSHVAREPASPWRLVALAVALRCAVPVVIMLVHGSFSRSVTSDGVVYLDLASHLVDSGRFATAEGPETFRMPGFPLLLALVLPTPFPVAAALFVNALLGGATVLLAHRTANELAGPRAAWWTGLLCAIEPGQIIMSGFVLSESLFATLVTALAAAGVRHLRAPGPRGALLLGLLAACAAYVKVIAYLLPLWLAFTLVLCGAGRPRRRLLDIGVMLLAAAVPIGAWQVRNGLGTGFWGFSIQIERHVAYGQAVAIRTAGQGRSRSLRPAQGAYAPEREWHLDRDYGLQPMARQELLGQLRSDPLPFVLLHLGGVVLTLTDPGANLFLNLFSPDPPPHPMLVKQLLRRGGRRALTYARRAGFPLIAAEGLLFALLSSYLVLAVRGASQAPQRRTRLWLLGIAAYFVILSSGPFSQMRFRAPVMPVLSILAGTAIAARPTRRSATELERG